MMNHTMLRNLVFMLGASALTFSGCARSQPTRFYVLTALERWQGGDPAGAAGRPISVGVGPIEFPAYLDRPQIVSREGEHRLHLAEFDRWAEPLGPRFALVLAENLSRLLTTEQVVVLPRAGKPSVDYQVVVEVVRLDGQRVKEIELIARWAVHGPDATPLSAMKRSEITVPLTEPGYDGVVAAMSRAVAELSREIAAVISSFESNPR